jgi:hypothetical protein
LEAQLATLEKGIRSEPIFCYVAFFITLLCGELDSASDLEYLLFILHSSLPLKAACNNRVTTKILLPAEYLSSILYIGI